jgi:phospholipid/cholesterol/gamma-HCH transport system substrate-binding protein
MTPTGKHFILGLTTLVALIGAVALLMLFGELDTFVRSRYAVTFDCGNAAGLRSGSPIELNGVPIGQVHDVSNTRDAEYPVRIVGHIDNDVMIPADIVPFATASLLGGSATLMLEASGETSATLSTDGRAILRGPIQSGLMQELIGALDSRMEPLVSGLEDFRELARNINDLVKPGDPDQPGDVRNIRTAVITLNQVLDDVTEALAMAKTWLGDDQLRGDARLAVRNANVLIEQATDTMVQFADLAGRIQTDSESVSKHLAPVLDELASTLEEVHDLTARATQGQGTIAQLLNNPDLYMSLNDAAIRLERTLRDVQLLVEKVKGEGLPAIW